MSIMVLLPAALRPHAGGAEMLTITAPVNSVTELLAALERTAPRLMRHFDRSMFTLAVNGAMPIDRVSNHMLQPGDRVEIVPV